ncbi:hypothetical protein TNCV_376791 [Trichonephila clavipes]|nr:hypothetical protein TNCV_376791 [Trichonephila clavipes]
MSLEYRLLRRQSTQPGPSRSRRGMRKQNSSFGPRGRSLGRRDQLSVPANLPQHPFPIHRLGYAVSYAHCTSTLKCAGAPSCWKHIRALILAGTLCSRTLLPYKQFAPNS